MNSETPEGPGGGLEILEKVDALISALAQHGEMSAAVLAGEVQEPVSSTYRLLANLSRSGWVAPGSRRGLYRLGLFFMRVGGQLEDSLDIRERTLPPLQKLLNDTGQTAYLCVRDGLRAVCIERLDGGDVRSMALTLGASLPLIIGGAPKAILAFLPDSEYESVRDASLAVARQEGRPRDVADVDRAVAGIRRDGISVSDGDVTAGVAALGAPVFNHRGELVAAVSVSGIRAHILDDGVRARSIEAIRRCGQDVSAALGWHGEVSR
jgi:DNA-binding IclR family transcriptional regulator